jgi:DNA replication protein DnaC
MMTALQLAGMRAAYDEIVISGVKRQQGVEKVIGALLKAEIAAKQARSINYQMGVAKLPLAKELNDLDFTGTPINDELIAHLATGAFLEEKRNVVLVGGTGSDSYCSSLDLLKTPTLSDADCQTADAGAGGPALPG